jgi:hypothetical protein
VGGKDEIARLAAKTRTDSGDEAKDVFRKAVVSYIDTPDCPKA